jgi:hypothetical protein
VNFPSCCSFSRWIVRAGNLWRPGLRFGDFEEGILDLSRLQTGNSAQFDIGEYPLFRLALSAVPTILMSQ